MKILRCLIILGMIAQLLNPLDIIFGQDPETVMEGSQAVSGNVTLDFKDADITNVLRILSYKSFAFCKFNYDFISFFKSELFPDRFGYGYLAFFCNCSSTHSNNPYYYILVLLYHKSMN